MKNQVKNKIPEKLIKKSDWLLSRNQFLKTILAGSALTQIPLGFYSANANRINSRIFTEEQSKIIGQVLEILLPTDENGPGAKEINALEYLEWVLSDKEMDQEVAQYILNGIGWVNETSNEVFSENYVELTREQKEQLINKISLEGWGENWLSVILSYIFEALLCDPQYGGNPGKIGWEWLNHMPGQPRPSKELLYPEILLTVKKP